MDKKSKIVSLAYWRGEKKKSTPKTQSGNTAYSTTSDYERRLADLEARLEKVTSVLTEVAEDTSLNRKTILKLLRLLKEKT